MNLILSETLPAVQERLSGAAHCRRLRRMKSRIVFLCLAAFSCLNFFAAEPMTGKPVLLYSLYFEAPGENRYLPDGKFKDVMAQLRTEFEVRISSEPLTAKTLADVNVLLIANPNDKAHGTNPPPHHVSKKDIKTISNFVERGGGLILMSNQDGHNDEVEDVNKLLVKYGLQLTNLYTDIKLLTVPKETPVIGGLRWGFYTGNLILIETNHPAEPRSLITNDPSQKLLGGKRDQAGSLLAVAESGHGRVVVATDCGWITNEALEGKAIDGVAIKDDDNWEIFRRLAHWAGGR
jgi:hypothetical protein